MPQLAKDFAAKLNSCLDDTGVPTQARERASILSKMLDIPKQQAWSLLEGHLVPEGELLDRIASEFEVEKKWLINNKH